MTSQQKCGGQLVNSKIGRAGDKVCCPFCGKPVVLRRPFNGNNTGWVQVPAHNAAATAPLQPRTPAEPLSDHHAMEVAAVKHFALAAQPRTLDAPAERRYVCPVRTVADLVNNLLTLDQSLPIYGAQYIDHPTRGRCAIAVPPTVSRERLKDDRWIGKGDTLNAAIIWTRAEQPCTLDVPASLPELPPLDVKAVIPYESIRYVAGYPEDYVKRYATAYALAAGRAATPAQQPVNPKITLDFKQATELLQMLGGEPAEIVLQNGTGHSGEGLYAWYDELPEEGAEFLGKSDSDATPPQQAIPEGDGPCGA